MQNGVMAGRIVDRIGRYLAAATLVLVAAVATHGRAAAQQVVAVVNGDPITAIDITQRT